MRLRVSDPALIPDLLEFLRSRVDVVAEEVSDNEVDVSLVGSYNADAMNIELATSSVEVRSVLPTSDRTLEVEWIETTRDLYGAVKSQDHWKGAFTIAVSPPNDERLVRVNPLGVYVTNLSWGKVL